MRPRYCGGGGGGGHREARILCKPYSSKISAQTLQYSFKIRGTQRVSIFPKRTNHVLENHKLLFQVILWDSSTALSGTDCYTRFVCDIQLILCTVLHRLDVPLSRLLI